jgi:quinol monooxygenase YgiN
MAFLLRDFLSQEWIPALVGAKGCLSVELADNFTQTPMCVVIELWESQALHAESGSRLVQVTLKDVFEKLQSLSGFVFLWEGIVIRQSRERSDK